MKPVSIVLLLSFAHTALSRDFYIGMFRKDDFLVAADELYKARVPSRMTYAKYGKVFKCPITYFRIVDRLGTNSFPKIQVLRGGLKQKYMVVLLSVYNKPISVNIYAGCENKNKVVRTSVATTGATETIGAQTDATTSIDGATGDGDKEEGNTEAGGDEQKPEENAEEGGEPAPEENGEEAPAEEK